MRRSTGPDLHTVMAVLKRDGYRCIRDNAAFNGARIVSGWVDRISRREGEVADA